MSYTCKKAWALAKFWIDKECTLAENIGFTAKELNEISSIIGNHTDEIKEAWNGFFCK